MGKSACTCGHIISDVQCPNEVTGWLLSDKSGESFFRSITDTVNDCLQHAADSDLDGWRGKHFNELYPTDVSVGDMIHDVLTSQFFDLTLAAMECDECGRMWVQQSPGMNHYHGYSADDPPAARAKVFGYNRFAGDSAEEL